MDAKWDKSPAHQVHSAFSLKLYQTFRKDAPNSRNKFMSAEKRLCWRETTADLAARTMTRSKTPATCNANSPGVSLPLGTLRQ